MWPENDSKQLCNAFLINQVSCVLDSSCLMTIANVAVLAPLCLVCVAGLIAADSQLCSFISSASLAISDSEVRQQDGLV